MPGGGPARGPGHAALRLDDDAVTTIYTSASLDLLVAHLVALGCSARRGPA